MMLVFITILKVKPDYSITDIDANAGQFIDKVLKRFITANKSIKLDDVITVLHTDRMLDVNQYYYGSYGSPIDPLAKVFGFMEKSDKDRFQAVYTHIRNLYSEAHADAPASRFEHFCVTTMARFLDIVTTRLNN